MNALHQIHSPAVVLARDNIDTDQIIPARYLTTTSSSGLGRHAFADWPGTPGERTVHDRRGAKILVAGHNFGCGSSREHAVWALLDAGFCAVVSTGFADIFRANALRNRLLPVVMPADIHGQLLATIDHNPDQQVHIDVSSGRICFGEQSVAFPLDDFSRHLLLRGLDELSFLLEQLPAITAYESARKPRVDTSGGGR